MPVAVIQFVNVPIDRNKRNRASGSTNSELSRLCYSSALSLARAISSRCPSNLSYYKDQNGKPHFSNGCNLYFSISHSGNTGLVAVSDVDIGVDMEEVTPTTAGVLREVFQETALESLDPADHLSAWTAYEAVSKASGLGLRLDLQKLNYLESSVVCQVTKYHVHRLPTPAGYVGCIASRRKIESFIEIFPNTSTLDRRPL